MLKSTLAKIVFLIMFAFIWIILSLFVANIITYTIHWFVPLTPAQIEMSIYLMFLFCVIGAAHWVFR